MNRLRSPDTRAPCVNAALAARPRRAEGCCAAHKIFDFAGAPNRGASAEAQCGTAPRAARDLPARPVPRKTAGAPEMERPKTIPSGSPLRCAQWGTKEMVPPGGTREKSSGPRSAFARRKLKCTPDTPTIAAFLRKCSAAPNRGPGAICQRGQCRARRRELQEWSDQSPSHWGPRRAQRGGEWNHVPP